MPTPAKANTTTPDLVAGSPIDVVTLDAGAGAVDRQVVAVADATVATQYMGVTAAGAAKVDGSAVTQPVSGTFFQATQPVSAAALPLPTGASTEATLALIKAKTDNLDVLLSTRTKPADTQPISAAALPLPAGASTEATLATRLADATFTGRINTQGQKAMAASTPVVVASDQSAIPVSGTLAISTIAGGITPGTAAGNLGKAEDAAHADGDTGVFVMGIRTDVPNLPTASPSSANSDYSRVATDAYGVGWVRKRQLASYTASYRLADATAGQLDLTFGFTANTNKQVATIYHAATSTKTVKVRKVSVFFTTLTAAIVGMEIRALSATTAPATGNPAITPRQHAAVDGAAEATCLALPTTAGSVVGADNATVSPHVSINAGATTASVSPASFGTTEVVLYEYKDGSEEKPLTMLAGVAEGFAVMMRSTAATAQRFTVVIKFTEE